VTLDGTIIRIKASTLAKLSRGKPALTGNTNRIVATGMRNPFRITTRPGTSEVWVGDVGWNNWERSTGSCRAAPSRTSAGPAMRATICSPATVMPTSPSATT